MADALSLALKYIEQNLKTDISTEELAQLAHYSAGHFCRLFAQTMETTVGSYILKRRLDYALMDISQGKKAIDVVHDYGFDTYAGFYKAFVKMYGCSPKKYIKLFHKKEALHMLQTKDLYSILSHWDIDPKTSINDVSTKNWKTGATEWQVWAVGDDYLLKTNERSKMIKNINIAKALMKEGLQSEFLPICINDGGDYVDGAQIYMLTKKIGKPLITAPLSTEEIMNMEFNNDRRQHAFKLGQAVAKLHCALKSIEEDIRPHQSNIYAQGMNAIKKVRSLCLKHQIYFEEHFFDDYETTFGALYEQLPKQLIHGNLTGDSVVYENGEIIGMKGYGVYHVSHVRLFDLTWCAGEIELNNINAYLDLLKTILKGYDSINPLTTEEKQAVYYLLITSAMNTIAYVNDDTLDVTARNMAALVYLAEHKEIFMNLI